MSRRKRIAADASAVNAEQRFSFGSLTNAKDLWQLLTKPRRAGGGFKQHEVTYVFSNLSTLVQNGVPLPKALATLAREEHLARHRETLEALRRRVESGVAFSTALEKMPGFCDELTVSQIRLAERSGNLAETLAKVSQGRNKHAELRKQIIKKLAYPVLLIVVGSCLITFLLMFVIPVFEETYSDAGVPLPAITQFMIDSGGLVRHYGWLLLVGVAAGVVTIRQLRRRPVWAERIDAWILRLPLAGVWIRDMAVLQLMEVLQNMMESGYTLSEALNNSADSVGNRAVRRGVLDLQRAVKRGERFSRELERHEKMFPPIVSQLVLVGESTGKLARSASDICEYLRREIDRKTDLMVGALEPILTLSLATAIGVVLLSIYLPMFDMVHAVGK
jgi:type II secretory pathway component PulF